jgi:hypothetical protein
MSTSRLVQLRHSSSRLVQAIQGHCVERLCLLAHATASGCRLEGATANSLFTIACTALSVYLPRHRCTKIGGGGHCQTNGWKLTSSKLKSVLVGAPPIIPRAKTPTKRLRDGNLHVSNRKHCHAEGDRTVFLNVRQDLYLPTHSADTKCQCHTSKQPVVNVWKARALFQRTGVCNISALALSVVV